jgi:hypothetical protein
VASACDHGNKTSGFVEDLFNHLDINHNLKSVTVYYSENIA